MRKVSYVFMALGLVLSLAVIGVVGWQAGWWLEAKNTDRRVQIDNRQKGTQTAWSDEARNAISDYLLLDPANTATRGALRNKACVLINRLTYNYKDDDLVAFETKECK